MVEYVAVCQECDWEKPMPMRKMAEHVKGIHENRYGHTVIIES